MSDREWRELERRLARDPGDEGLAAQAIAARRRAGAPVPRRLSQALTRAGFTFAAPVPLGVGVVTRRKGEAGGHALVGDTASGPVHVPPHLRWAVSPVVLGRPAPQGAAADEVTGWLTGATGAWPEEDPPALDLEDWPASRLDWLPRVPWLRALLLGRDPFLRDADLAALEPLAALEHLDVDALSVTDAGVVRLAALRGLTHLALRCPRVGDPAMSWVARLPRLTDLDLRGHRVTERGLERLAPLPHLDSLSLDAGELRPAALDALAALPALRHVTLRNPRLLTEDALAAFAAARPDVVVRLLR